ncbi:MAG: ABC transporter substrate-binding protein [Thermodesulfobacteriota bacterium]
MTRKLILLTVVLAAFAVSLLGGRAFLAVERAVPLHAQIGPPESLTPPCDRIVSLAPSITEEVFALGLGEKVVGVTRFCDYPPAALKIKRVGGYFDPNYEAILALEPGIVILLPEHREAREYMEELGLNTFTVNHGNISGILNSAAAMGRLCGAEEKAGEITSEIESRMKKIKEKTAGLKRPGVMVSINRDISSGTLKDVYIAGRDGFYDEMVNLAGGRNVYRGALVKYPVVSGEGMVSLNPDVIIDVVPDFRGRGVNVETALKDWRSIPGLKAAETGRVYLLGGNYVARPGPRFILILEDMARAIHPEIQW